MASNTELCKAAPKGEAVDGTFPSGEKAIYFATDEKGGAPDGAICIKDPDPQREEEFALAWAIADKVRYARAKQTKKPYSLFLFFFSTSRVESSGSEGGCAIATALLLIGGYRRERNLGD